MFGPGDLKLATGSGGGGHSGAVTDALDSIMSSHGYGSNNGQHDHLN